MCIPIYQNTNITKKTCCIKLVPTECFACKAHHRTPQIKKSNIIYVERNKEKLKVKLNFYASDENLHLLEK